MQISLLTFLTQPPAEPGASSTTGLETPAGSRDFQAIMSQMAGSDGSQPAGDTAAPALPWKLPSLPMPAVSSDLQPEPPAEEASAPKNAAVIPATIEPDENAGSAAVSSTPDQPEIQGTSVPTLAQALVADLMRLRVPDGAARPSDADGSASEPVTLPASTTSQTLSSRETTRTSPRVSSDMNALSGALAVPSCSRASEAEVPGNNSPASPEVTQLDNVTSAGPEILLPSQKIPGSPANSESTMTSGEVAGEPASLIQANPDSESPALPSNPRVQTAFILPDGSGRIVPPAPSAAPVRLPEPKVTASNQAPAQMTIPPAETGSGFQTRRSEPLASATSVAGEIGSLYVSASGPAKETAFVGLFSKAVRDVAEPVADAAKTMIPVPREEVLSAEYTLSQETAVSAGIPNNSTAGPTIQTTGDLQAGSLGHISKPLNIGPDSDQGPDLPLLQEPAPHQANEQAPLVSTEPSKADAAYAAAPQRSAQSAIDIAPIPELLLNRPSSVPPDGSASEPVTAPVVAESADQPPVTVQTSAPVTSTASQQANTPAAGAGAISVPSPTPPSSRGQGTDQMRASEQDGAPAPSAASQPSVTSIPGAEAAPAGAPADIRTMLQPVLHKDAGVPTDAPTHVSTTSFEVETKTPGSTPEEAQPFGAVGAGEAFAAAGDKSSSKAPAVEIRGSAVDREVKEAKTPSAAGSSPKEVFKPSDGAESAEARTSMAQATLSRNPEKPPVDQARPGKTEVAGNDKAVRESLPDLTIASGEKTASVPKATAAPPSKPAELVYQIADRIQSQLQSGQGEVRIQLKPEHLGNLEIKAENGAGGIVARIAAESNSVKQYLESNIHTLQQSLQEQGLKVDRIDVVLQPSLDARQAGTQQQNPNQTGTGSQGSNAEGSNSGSRQDSPRRYEVAIDPTRDVVLGPNSTFHTIA